MTTELTNNPFDQQPGPIKLLAPQTIASVDADPDQTIIIEMTRDAFLALRDGVTVAFEDEESVPREWREMASAWWVFLHPDVPLA